MELYESRFKKFLNVAKVMKMVGEGEKISGDDAMDVAKNFYDSLLDIDGNDARVLSYIKNILNNKEFVKDYSIDDHIEAYRVSESKIEEGLSSAILSVLASAIMSGSILSTDPHKGDFNPDDFDHGDGVEMVDFGDGIGDKERKSGNDPHKKGFDPHSIAGYDAEGIGKWKIKKKNPKSSLSEGDEMEYESAITFKQAKELGLLPIDGRKTTTKVKEKYMDYFTITKPNEDGFSKVIYWIKKEDAINAGDSFSLDDDIDSSLYS